MKKDFEPARKKLFLVYLLDDIVGRHGSRDIHAVGKDERGRTVDPEFLAELNIVVDCRGLARRIGDLLFLKCLFKEREGLFALYGLCYPGRVRMHRKRVQQYIKGDVLPLFQNLLHLLMKSCAERSLRVVEDDDLVLRLLVSHHKRVAERYLRDVNFI